METVICQRNWELRIHADPCYRQQKKSRIITKPVQVVAEILPNGQLKSQHIEMIFNYYL